jgi:hypothetical protein
MIAKPKIVENVNCLALLAPGQRKWFPYILLTSIVAIGLQDTLC